MPKQVFQTVVEAVGPHRGKNREGNKEPSAEITELHQRLNHIEGELRELRNLTETLNHDLDESRRLNLRAAELMDVAFTQLAN